MDPLISNILHDTLTHLREVVKTTPTLLATAEEVAYFAPRPTLKKESLKTLPPPPTPVPVPKKTAPTTEHITPQAPPPTPRSTPKQNFNEMRQVVEKTFPGLVLRDTTPDDAHAKKRSCLWKETYLTAHVVVVAFGEVGSGLQFLKKMTDAIHTLIAPAQLVEGLRLEKENSWDLLLSSPVLKYIICSPHASWKSTSLNQHYRQNGATQEHFLGPHKLLLLEPSLTYLNNPERKRSLWQTINMQLSS